MERETHKLQIGAENVQFTCHGQILGGLGFRRNSSKYQLRIHTEELIVWKVESKKEHPEELIPWKVDKEEVIEEFSK